MEKYTWYVLVIRAEDGGNYAIAERIGHSNNLKGYAADPRVISMNACDTKRDAEAIARYWCECYKRNGTAADWLK